MCTELQISSRALRAEVLTVIVQGSMDQLEVNVNKVEGHVSLKCSAGTAFGAGCWPASSLIFREKACCG